MRKHILIFFLAILITQGNIFCQSLKISENQRFLVTESGKGFFWLGDTGWEMLHRLDKKEIEQYYKNRAEKGFTLIQTVILGEINGLTVPNMEGHLPLVDMDPEQPNNKYFELVDFAVNKAADYNLFLALLPTWGSYVADRNKSKRIFHEENAYIYGKFLGERYRDKPNIIWVLGGDRPAEGFEKVWEAMARGLREGDKGKHLITYHPRGQQTSSEWFHQAEWLDFNMVQTGHTAPNFCVYDYITNDYNLDPSKPVINGEPAYEDICIWLNGANPRHDAYEIRKQAYWSVFAGAFGHTYGNNNIWQMYKREFEPVIWASSTWSEALEHPGAGQLIHLRSLMESRPFLSRIPDQSILKNNNPSYAADHIRVTRDGTYGQNDASYIMLYLPYYKSFNVDTRVIEGKNLKVWWYSPSTGQTLVQGEFENTGQFNFNLRSNFIKPDQMGPDWVIVIDDVARNYPQPGKP